VNAGYLAVFLNSLMKFNFIKLRDDADWWVPDVRISEQYMFYLNFIFVPRECWLLGYFEPATD
jgi:hypothetical protein